MYYEEFVFVGFSLSLFFFGITSSHPHTCRFVESKTGGTITRCGVVAEYAGYCFSS